MGLAIRALINASEDLSFVGGVDLIGDPEVGIVTDLEAIPPEVDVILDFSDMRATLRLLPLYRAAGKPVVIGTTGFMGEHQAQIEEISQDVPVFMSPNMSLGVNIMFWITDELMKLLSPDYDVEILEIHHNRKKDAPSGTARRLLDIVASARDYSLVLHGREGLIGARKKEEIGMHAVRAGDVIGEHRVIVAGNQEMLEITHRCLSRDTLARGTLEAARFVLNRAPGMCSMEDLLDLKLGG